MSKSPIQQFESKNKIQALIIQSIAIINLLENDGQDVNSGFHSPHDVIINSIWVLSDLLNAAQNELRGI